MRINVFSEEITLGSFENKLFVGCFAKFGVLYQFIVQGMYCSVEPS